MWRLNSRFVGAYAEKDAELTLKLWNMMRVDLEKQSLMDVFNLGNFAVAGDAGHAREGCKGKH